MRNGQNKQRMRNRNNNNNNNNRRGQNPMTRVYESNGPDIKIRGTASHIAEKYLQLARDARSSGDPVAAENYYQHAEHYFRLIAAAQEQFRQNQQPRGDEPISSNSDDGEDDGENFSNFGQEPGFVPQPPQQQQPFMRDRDGQRDQQREYQPRDNQQPYQRDQQQPREHRERDHRPQPQYQQPQPPQNQPQPVVADAGSVDRLPSFITGAQPQANGAPGNFEGGNGGGGERYPRRRRRPHNGPRPEREAAPAATSDDLASGE